MDENRSNSLGIVSLFSDVIPFPSRNASLDVEWVNYNRGVFCRKPKEKVEQNAIHPITEATRED